MTNAALKGKPYAGNPHVRFDEGEVASGKPRRGSLLYNTGKSMLLVFGALAALNATAAKVLRLQGSGDMTWDNTTATWLDENNNLTTYCGAWNSGDDAIIGGTCFTGSTLTLNFWCHAGDVVFTNSQDVALAVRKDGATSPAFGSQTKSLQKWGEGLLSVAGDAWMYNTCDWNLYQGTLTPSGSTRPSTHNGAWSWGEVSASHRPRINVWGGVLEGHGNESFGLVSSTVADEDLCSDVVVHTNGTFRPGITANCSNGYPLSLIHDLVLDGGTFDTSKKGYWGTGLLAVYHKLSLSGVRPYSLTFPGQCGKLGISRARQTEIEVADITGDAATDVTFADANIGPLGSPSGVYSVGFRKTGAGTLVFSKQIKNSEDGGSGRGLIGLNGKITVAEGLVRFDAGNNKNEGDIEVTGGALRLGDGTGAYTVPSDLGQTYAGSLLKEGRTIAASGSGRIYFPQRYMFYLAAGVGAETVAPATFVAKDGGELVIGAPDWPGGNATAMFPNVRLENGGRVTLRPESGSWPNGAYGVMGKFSFGGSAPITVPAGTAQNHVFQLNSARSTEFEVEDVTGDAETDVTFSLPMGRYTYQIDKEKQRQVGFRKTGAGTLMIDFSVGGLGSAGMAAPNGTIAVEEGALIPAVSLTDVTLSVASGAFLQPQDDEGCPAVKAIVVAEGGGFRVRAHNASGSLCATASLQLPAKGVVDVIAADDQEAATANALFLTLADDSTVATSDFASWQVTVNGRQTTASHRIIRKGNGVFVERLRGFLCIIR